jgi:arylsulfatase A-like enzyme
MSGNVELPFLNRRGFLRGLLAALGGLLAVGGAGFWWQKRRDRRRPNVILILADDLGYGDLGPYGQARIMTPNLDRLAAEGMIFSQAYAGSSICAPSRCCLMTGLHTGHARIRHNKTCDGEGRVGLRPDDLTVAELLKSGGYATAIFGKWGMGYGNTPGTPNNQGFDEFLGRINERTSQYYPEFLWRNEEKEVLEDNLDGETGTFSEDLFTQEALSFVEVHQDERFFLFLSYNYPHANEAPDDTGKTMPMPVSDEPYSGESWPQEEKNFAAMITRMDRDIGTIISRLRELGLDRNTCVFFTSDNGPHGTGGHKKGFFESRGVLSGSKGDLLEGGIRVPMVAWWPGTIEPGVVSDQVLAFWDFLPTAADLAGAQLPAERQFDGISMLPALLGKPQQDHDFLYWEIPCKGFHQAVRMGDWKAMRERRDSDIMLFNLVEDVGEKVNVAADHPEIVAEIARIMETAHTPSEDFA